MREVILKAVANPPKILWGPFLPTLINVGLQFPVMFVSIGTFDANPLVFVISVIIVHAFIIFAGSKEPHISSMIQAFGQANKRSNNLYKAKGNKFEP